MSPSAEHESIGRLTSSLVGELAVAESRVLPLLGVDDLNRLVERGLATDRPAWAREVRGWARERRTAG